MIRIESLIFFTLFFLACGSPEIHRTNDLADRERATKFCDSFYDYVAINDLDKIKTMVGSSGLRFSIKKVIFQSDSMFGAVKSRDLMSVESKVDITADGETGSYSLLYKCQHDSLETMQRLIISNKNGVLRLDEFHIGY